MTTRIGSSAVATVNTPFSECPMISGFVGWNAGHAVTFIVVGVADVGTAGAMVKAAPQRTASRVMDGARTVGPGVIRGTWGEAENRRKCGQRARYSRCYASIDLGPR